jgi:hypothetical protein
MFTGNATDFHSQSDCSYLKKKRLGVYLIRDSEPMKNIGFASTNMEKKILRVYLRGHQGKAQPTIYSMRFGG